MLEVVNAEHFAKVVTEACARGLAEPLFAQLLYLHHYADHELTGRCEVLLGYDFAPLSFGVAWRWAGGSNDMVGGLIFHASDETWGVHT